MRDYLRLIDGHTRGRRCDVTPLFADAEAFARLVADLAVPFADADLDYVAGIDALGFILGTAVALYLKVGFIPIRKEGKLPVPVEHVEFVDYSGQKKGLELRVAAIRRDSRVLLVDEWIETGTQALAALELLERAGARVASVVAINIDDNEATRTLCQRYQCHSVWRDMEEDRAFPCDRDVEEIVPEPNVFLYKIQPVRPEMLSDRPTADEDRIVDEHFAYLRRLTEAGVVLLAGRTLNTDPGAFGIVILAPHTEEAARQVMHDDPAVRGRVMRAELYPFRIALLGSLPPPG
jgi:adenine phosphoribosyltransferase